MEIIYLLVFALLFACLFKYFNVPGAFLIGSIVGAAIYTIIFGAQTLPIHTKFVAQTITGAFIGSTINRDEVKQMFKIIKPVTISITSMIIGMFVSGLVLYFIFDFDLPTALLSAVPGGISDITLMSSDFNADTNTVALFQMMRLFSVIAFLPHIIKSRFTSTDFDENEVTHKTHKKGYQNIIITLIIAFIGSSIGRYLKIPAGALSISMFAVILVNYHTDLCYIPRLYRSFAQVSSGCLIGIGVTMDTIIDLPTLILPIIIVLTFYLIFNYVVSYIINKTTDMDMATAMFATAPAGASDMVLIASEMKMDVNQSQIVLMHVARLVSVVTLFPMIISLILKLAS